MTLSRFHFINKYHLAETFKNRKSIWLLMGPAFAAAIGYIDPGNYATNIQAGAKYGYALLWVVVVSNIMAAFIQYFSSKLGLATNQSLATHIKNRVPKSVAYFYWIQTEVIAIATDLAEVIGASLGFKLVFGVTLLQGAVFTAVFSWLILMLQKQGLKKIEFIVAIMLLVVCGLYIIELFFALPDPDEVAFGMINIQIPDNAAIYLSAGILGATIMPHVIYLHSSMSKKDAQNLSVKQRKFAVKVSRWDVGLAMLIASFVNLAMLAMAAASLHNAPGISPDNIDLTKAYETLAPILGNHASLIFGISLIVAGIASTVIGTLAGQELMSDFVSFKIPLTVRRILTMFPSFIIIYLGINATKILIFSQVILSFGIAFAVVPLIHFCSKESIMGQFTLSKKLQFIGWVIVAVVISLNAFLLMSI